MTRTAVDRLFMISVADATAYNDTGDIIFTGKTLMDSNITVKTSNSDVRGGKGAKLQYIYWHSADWTGTIQDTQFNLALISAATGANIGTGSNTYTQESVTLGTAGAGTITGTAISDQSSGSPIYGWVSFADGNTEKVTFSGQNFTASTGASGEVVCINYFHTDAAAKTITVPSDIIPKIARLVLDTQLASSDESSNIVGKVEVIIPKAQFTGSFTISMKSDGVATTPIEYRALSYKNPSSTGGCADTEAYAYINQVIDGALWTDDLYALGIVNGDFSVAVSATKQLVVLAIHKDGSVSTPPVADLTFSSSVPGKATVSLHGGLVTGVASGTTVISVYPTAAATFDASVTATVP